jgi:hypothetical protein
MQRLAGFLELMCVARTFQAGAWINPQASGTTVFIPPGLAEESDGLSAGTHSGRLVAPAYSPHANVSNPIKMMRARSTSFSTLRA